MVPRAEFRSYYGRPVLKPPAWEDDIAYYFFLGGLSAGCSLLGAGADLTGRPALRRGARLGALASLGLGAGFLVKDLGRPERFHHMLRVAKPTSPMSVGTWLLTAYGPAVGVAAVSEVLPKAVSRSWVGGVALVLARPTGLAAAAIAPLIAAYTAPLLSQTAVPAWREAALELPFVFTGSSLASAGGWGLVAAPVGQNRPARGMAVWGAALELAASEVLHRRLGLVREAYEAPRPHRERRVSTWLTAAGGAGALLLGGRSRVAAAVSGAALLAGSLLQRLEVLHAGVESTEDPRYVVAPQRTRLDDARRDVR